MSSRAPVAFTVDAAAVAAVTFIAGYSSRSTRA
jgi:hypothetical protein